MPTVWTDLGSEDYGVGAPIDDALFGALETNDEAGIDHTFQLDFGVVPNGSASYAVVHTVELVIGEGTKALRIRVSSRMQVSGSGSVKCTLAGAVDSDVQTVSGTTGTVYTCAFADVSAYRGQRVTLEIKSKTATGGGEIIDVYSQNQAICTESYD